MSIMDRPIADIWRAPRDWALKVLSDRPQMSANVFQGTGGLFGAGQPGMTSKLDAMSSSGWLFAGVERIATAVASAEWGLYRQQANADRALVPDHPLWDLWERPNPFFTRFEFLEISMTNFEIAGEIFWAIVRGEDGAPLELWPLRPDRVKVVPHPDEYISGYVYQIGKERIPLEREDMVFIRRPSDRVDYRGASVIESILTDLDTDRKSAEWNRVSFANGAQPGGILEVDRTLDDNAFRKMTDRWRQQHQGVANANRVAIIEKAVFKEMKYTRRDLQWVDGRKFGRDIVFGALGIPLSVMGIAENVNLANALVGATNFANWTVTPRLRRLKQGSNQYLVPLLDPTGTLSFDFEDPTPPNRELNLDEAERGYTAGILTQNEARARIGEAAVTDGGDEFYQPPTPAFGLGAEWSLRQAQPMGKFRPIRSPELAGDERAMAAAWGVNGHDPVPFFIEGKAKALPGQEEVNDDADAMQDAWETRLEAEVEAVIVHLESFEASTLSVPSGLMSTALTQAETIAATKKGIADWRAGRTTPLGQVVHKFEPSDIESYDWDWWLKYGDEVIEELTSVFFSAITTGFPNIIPSEATRLAVQYATERGGELLVLDGNLSLARTTRARVRKLTADALENGDSLGKLAKQLREDPAFGRSRAINIARTETSTALGQGEKQASILQGRNEKHWVTQGDDVVEEDCMRNEAAGWIPINDLFPTGKDTIPQHPRCRCVVRSRTNDDLKGIDVRCPKCNALLGRNVVAAEFTCRRCGWGIVVAGGMITGGAHREI